MLATRALALLILLVPAFASSQKNAKARHAPDDLSVPINKAFQLLIEMQESLDEGKKIEGPESEWPYEGVYRVGGEIPIGYRVGGTAIGAAALIATPVFAESEDGQAAVERAVRFIGQGLDEELMESGFKGRYDVRGWGHTYALDFYLHLRKQALVPKKLAKEIDRRIAWLVQTIQDTEIKETGGWNYSRRGGYEEPGPASPFMTAPTLLALFEARAQGEAVDQAVVGRALDALEHSRLEDGAIPYTTAQGKRSSRAKIEGATGRMPVTEVVLFLAGRSDVANIQRALDAFLEHWEWLEKRRRQTGTHVEPFGIAPYYFFYAHRYAAQAIEFLPEDLRSAYRMRFLERLFQVQEPSGGWNDRVFPRSENFGTAFSLLALLEPDRQRPTAW